jgi:hypothetical protein
VVVTPIPFHPQMAGPAPMVYGRKLQVSCRPTRGAPRGSMPSTGRPGPLLTQPMRRRHAHSDSLGRVAKRSAPPLVLSAEQEGLRHGVQHPQRSQGALSPSCPSAHACPAACTAVRAARTAPAGREGPGCLSAQPGGHPAAGSPARAGRQLTPPPAPCACPSPADVRGCGAQGPRARDPSPEARTPARVQPVLHQRHWLRLHLRAQVLHQGGSTSSARPRPPGRQHLPRARHTVLHPWHPRAQHVASWAGGVRAAAALHQMPSASPSRRSPPAATHCVACLLPSPVLCQHPATD